MRVPTNVTISYKYNIKYIVKIMIIICTYCIYALLLLLIDVRTFFRSSSAVWYSYSNSCNLLMAKHSDFSLSLLSGLMSALDECSGTFDGGAAHFGSEEIRWMCVNRDNADSAGPACVHQLQYLYKHSIYILYNIYMYMSDRV